MAATEGDSLFLRLSELGVSAIGGALVVLVTFRTKLALMDREIAARKRENERERAERKAEMQALEHRIGDRLDLLDRRSIEQLRLTADIAKKVGADNRLSDSVIRMLADDNSGTSEGGHS